MENNWGETTRDKISSCLVPLSNSSYQVSRFVGCRWSGRSFVGGRWPSPTGSLLAGGSLASASVMRSPYCGQARSQEAMRRPDLIAQGRRAYSATGHPEVLDGT